MPLPGWLAGAQVIQLFACCSEDCPPCPDTVWQPGPGRAEGSGLDAMTAPMASHSRGKPRCGLELGRWVTPFRRRNPLGWITDVSTLLPALLPGSGGGGGHATAHGQQCTFTLQTAPWASGWRASLDLRFQAAQGRAADGSSSGERGSSSRQLHASRAVRGALSGTLSADPSTPSTALRLMQQPTWPAPADSHTQAATRGLQPLQLLASDWRPVAVIPLFTGGVFNGSYNQRDPIVFVSPVGEGGREGAAPLRSPAVHASPMRGVLSALISGHGEDGADACAEFCPTRCVRCGAVCCGAPFRGIATAYACMHVCMHARIGDGA